MKILMINKFLYPKGGAETYMLKLGEYLQNHGHEVAYFGMDHPQRTVGNRIGVYTAQIDFHNSSLLTRMTYPFRIIYSAQARRQIRKVLEDFQPDVCHLNNFNYQLTPSILLEIRKWERETGSKCRIVYTAHDPQLVCPNHMCLNPNTHKVCEKCLHGSYWNCTKGKCIHGSFARSVLGSLESIVWHGTNVYRHIDTIICCSHFMKKLLDTNPILAERTVALHNFVEEIPVKPVEKKEYVLYFGRYSQEKGIATLVQAARELSHIPFVFAGAGPLENLLQDVPNIRNVGFQSGEALNDLIREASFAVLPSECYENCPFSVLESQMLGTFVLGADIGGIPELIRSGKNGQLFASGDCEDLKKNIEILWDRRQKAGCTETADKGEWLCSIRKYTETLLRIYCPETTEG